MTRRAQGGYGVIRRQHSSPMLWHRNRHPSLPEPPKTPARGPLYFFNGLQTSQRASRIPGPGAAATLLLLVAVLFLFGGLPLQLYFGEVGLLLAQLGFLLLPVVVFLWRGGFDLALTLSLHIPSSSQVLGGVLFLAGGLQLALVLTWLQSLVMPVPVEYLEAISGVLKADSLPRFFWLLLVAAVLPAVAEEVLFRGVVLSAFRQRLPAVWAVVAAGLIFGLFHLTPDTAFRFVPTAWLGILLGWVVVSSGSLPLAMLLHFLNNGMVLAVTAIPGVSDQATEVGQEGPPIALLVVGLTLFLLGLFVLQRNRNLAGDTS